MAASSAGLNVVLLGKTGAGKSASGNTILGREVFESHKSPMSLTRDVQMESGSVDGFPVDVYDTPGLLNTDMKEEDVMKKYEALLRECDSGPCVFLLVIKADRFTEEERETVEKIEKVLGEKRLKKTWILFTRGDELEEENVTIETFINDTERLKTLVQKYEQRYHVFNNRTRGDTEQVKTLFTKLKTPLVKGSRKLRIILLGQTGVGKSASGNTILGQREFVSVMRMNSVTSVCSEAQATVSGRSVSVVDTPGFNHTHMRPEDLVKKIAKSVYLSCPGPHAFLIVFPVNMRVTEREQQIFQKIEMMFDQEVLKYSIILFTHGDQLSGKTIEKLTEENSRVRALVDQCGGRFHVFNNKAVNDRDQVNELLQKIDSVIEQNGGGHYSTEMFLDAQRLRLREELEKVSTRLEELLRQREERQRLRRQRLERLREEIQRLEIQRLEIQREERRRRDESCVCS